MSQSYDDFLRELGLRESSGNYQAENRLHFYGKYQLGEAALVDTGYVVYDGNPGNNDYSKGWTGKDAPQFGVELQLEG